MTRSAQRDEFLPLPYVEPLRSTEARHVVRVSMTSGDEMILGVLPVSYTHLTLPTIYSV